MFHFLIGHKFEYEADFGIIDTTFMIGQIVSFQDNYIIKNINIIDDEKLFNKVYNTSFKMMN